VLFIRLKKTNEERNESFLTAVWLCEGYDVPYLIYTPNMRSYFYPIGIICYYELHVNYWYDPRSFKTAKFSYILLSYRISKFIKRRSRQRPLSSAPIAKTPRVEIDFDKGEGCWKSSRQQSKKVPVNQTKEN